MSDDDGALKGAWQATLAAEQRASFGYGLVGARLSGSASETLARTCAAAHDELVRGTQAALAAAKLTPASPEPDYPDLYPVTDAPHARALAVRLESDCAAAWRYLYAVAAAADGDDSASLRITAQQALGASAIRAVRWRQDAGADKLSVPFPGV